MESIRMKIVKDYYCQGELYKKSMIELKPGLTVLVGCNGAGKTTLLHQITDYLEKKDLPFIKFNNLSDGGTNAIDRLMFRGNTVEAATMMMSSEGERIHQNISYLVGSIGKKASKLEPNSDIFILLDAIDSGLSIDNIVDIKDFFNNIFIPDYKKTNGGDPYIIAVANEYEMANGEQCFDVQNCKYVTFKDYEDYKKFVLKSREIKSKIIDDYEKSKSKDNRYLDIERDEVKDE